MSAMLRRLTLAAAMMCSPTAVTSAQSLYFSTVPPNPNAGTSGTVAVDYYGMYAADYYCDGGSCWYEYENQDVSPSTFHFTVNGVTSTALTQQNPSFHCDFYGNGSYTCQRSGTFAGTVSWPAAGTKTLTATMSSDAGLLQADYSFSPPAAVVLGPSTATPLTDFDRDRCLTFSAGQNAAIQCGDVQVTHALPSVRTMGKQRTLSMLYNGHLALATQTIAADITVPAGMATPSRVTAEVYAERLGVTPLPLKTYGEWSAGDFVAGATRRIALAWWAQSDSSGAYGYKMVYHFWHGADPGPEYVINGAYVFVNRRSSPYGSAWWPAGLERLIIPAVGDLTVRSWIGGDGSAHLYRQVRANVWMAGVIDRPDSLTFDPANSTYTRWGPHRLEVRFDALGRHVATKTRTGDSTSFAYDPAASFRLLSVSVPRMTNAYTFEYNFGLAQPTIAVSAPSADGGPARQTVFTLTNNSRAWGPEVGPGQSVSFSARAWGPEVGPGQSVSFSAQGPRLIVAANSELSWGLQL